MSAEILFPPIITTLYSTPDLWFYDSRKNKLIESYVVKSMFVRRQTLEPLNYNDRADVDRYSVFFAMIRRQIKPPVYDFPNQKKQIWDVTYVKNLFDYWFLCITSPDSRKNKIAYTVNPRLTLDDLYQFKKEASL